MFKVEREVTFVLDGTIDGHNPIGCRFKITHDHGVFWFTVISVNWGRGYNPGEFKKNVMNVVNHVDGREYYALLIQELDEGDMDPEHQEFRKIMEPGTTLVEYSSREPIAVSPGVKVVRKRRRMTMDQGSTIGAPKNTGPRRFFVSCIAVIEGVRIGLGNQHPHRDMKNPRVQQARHRGERVTETEVGLLVDICDLVIHGGDMNDRSYPSSHPKERVAMERGLDTLRYIKA